MRDYNKDERLLVLSSIDKDLFRFIFDAAFDNIEEVMNTVENYNCQCYTEKNLVKMFSGIYSRIENEIPNNPGRSDEILDFSGFLLEKTLFIAIQSSIDMPHVFSVFESINSKGKPLDDIDKIKTYIFSILDESDYGIYLTRWGQLIINTDDCLGDYFQVYIRGFLCYYRQKINLKEFKYVARRLPSIYNVATLADALKKLIDDMLDKSKYYLLLFNCDEACKEVNKPEFTTFYKLYSCMGYSHPKSLFFRAFCEYFGAGNKQISKGEFTKIVKSATLFMFKFQSIRGGDSKDAIKYFENIAERHYNVEKLDADYVSNTFSNALIKEGIDCTVIKSSFMAIDFYSKHDLAYCVLSLLESIDENRGNKLLYSQASMMMSHIKDQTFHVDHLLPQRPLKTEKKFKYYCDSSSGEDLLVLKDGHDFPEDSVVNGMKYDEFESRTLHRLGNIRLYVPQLNGSRGNIVAQLPDHQDFTTYKQVIKRCEKLADLLLNSPDLK